MTGTAGRAATLMLAAAPGLSVADTGAISVTTDNVERVFGVGNTSIGRRSRRTRSVRLHVQYVFGRPGPGGTIGGNGTNASGLEYTCLVFLIPLLADGHARERDTAAASVRFIDQPDSRSTG